MAETKHTATPWEVNHAGNATVWIQTAEGDQVCTIDAPGKKQERIALATRIVRACNHHADLLAACEAIASVIWEGEEDQWPNDIAETARKARAAIAKATPGPQPAGTDKT